MTQPTGTSSSATPTTTFPTDGIKYEDVMSKYADSSEILDSSDVDTILDDLGGEEALGKYAYGAFQEALDGKTGEQANAIVNDVMSLADSDDNGTVEKDEIGNNPDLDTFLKNTDEVGGNVTEFIKGKGEEYPAGESDPATGEDGEVATEGDSDAFKAFDLLLKAATDEESEDGKAISKGEAKLVAKALETIMVDSFAKSEAAPIETTAGVTPASDNRLERNQSNNNNDVADGSQEEE